jgi:hypothetical protein
MQWPQVKRPDVGAVHCLERLVPRLKRRGEITSTPPLCLHGVVFRPGRQNRTCLELLGYPDWNLPRFSTVTRLTPGDNSKTAHGLQPFPYPSPLPRVAKVNRSHNWPARVRNPDIHQTNITSPERTFCCLQHRSLMRTSPSAKSTESLCQQVSFKYQQLACAFMYGGHNIGQKYSILRVNRAS